MTLSATDAELDLNVRRRRAKYRAWHRGMKEMDLILGRYADAHADSMSVEDIREFEHLMDVLDRDLFKWFTGECALPTEEDTPLFQSILRFHRIELKTGHHEE